MPKVAGESDALGLFDLTPATSCCPLVDVVNVRAKRVPLIGQFPDRLGEVVECEFSRGLRSLQPLKLLLGLAEFSLKALALLPKY